MLAVLTMNYKCWLDTFPNTLPVFSTLWKSWICTKCWHLVALPTPLSNSPTVFLRALRSSGCSYPRPQTPSHRAPQQSDTFSLGIFFFPQPSHVNGNLGQTSSWACKRINRRLFGPLNKGPNKVTNMNTAQQAQFCITWGLSSTNLSRILVMLESLFADSFLQSPGYQNFGCLYSLPGLSLNLRSCYNNFERKKNQITILMDKIINRKLNLWLWQENTRSSRLSEVRHYLSKIIWIIFPL